MRFLEALTGRTREFGLVFGMILILIVLFAPIPPMMLDLAILTNFGLSLTILLLTFYVAKPVEFSTFPSLLLLSTLLRLSLNVAATRLILTSAGAGEVINSIGSFAVGGNFVVGLVVFFILVVVQYVVVTSGAQRVSEVAARFTLDSMPGQQMSIDADLNMGLIDQKEALRRRAGLEKEGAFYGAMDGASKFVKGDAVAGVIILIIDMIAGWIIGVMQMGMSWSEALQRFTLLTVGDGIATQLPALIISIATGILVTRSAADRQLGAEILRQLSSVPAVPLIVAGMLALLLLLPGMPKWPIVLLLGCAYLAWRHARRSDQAKVEDEARAADAAANDMPSEGPAPISVQMGNVLSPAWRPLEAAILERIAGLRDAQEKALGVVFAPVQFREARELGGCDYEVSLAGVRYASGRIEPERMLAIKSEHVSERLDGLEANDPAFGLPATWIEQTEERRARDAGYTVVDPVTVFCTHLGEVLRNEAPAMLTRASVVRLLDGVRARQGGLVEELIPNLMSVSDVQRVLQNLLGEGVSIASIDLIAEHLVDVARGEKDVGVLTELLRQRLGHAICDKLKDRRKDLAVMSLDPRLEAQVQSAVSASGKHETLALDPRLAEQIIRKIALMSNEMVRMGLPPVLLCGSDIRRQIRALMRRSSPKLSVLSVSEIPTNIDLRSHGIIKLDPPKAEVRQEKPATTFSFQPGIGDAQPLQ